MLPTHRPEVLCIDPETSSVSTFGMVGGIRCKWRGGVVGGDGKIYCVPDCASQVLCIDPATQSTSVFGELGNGRWKWRGGALALDGRIYCAPYEPSGPVLCITPSERKAVTIGATPACGSQRLPGYVRSHQGQALSASWA